MANTSIPIVSVIIPTYNRAQVVGDAISSVLHQTYQNFEIILVDDASTDDTEEVARGFGDPRIHYLRHQQNLGAPRARNSGAEIARGEYFAFLDSDDLWYPEFLQRQFAVLMGSPLTVGMSCCHMVRKVGDSRRVMGPRTRRLTFDENVIHADGFCTSSFLIRRAAFYTVGRFDVTFRSFQDFDFLLRMAAEYQIEAIEDVLLEYRLGEDSISRNMSAKAHGLERVLHNYQGDILRLGMMPKYLFRLGQYHILSGYLQRGRRVWVQALRYKVWDAKIWKHLLLTLGGIGLYRRFLLLHNRRAERQHTGT